MSHLLSTSAITLASMLGLSVGCGAARANSTGQTSAPTPAFGGTLSNPTRSVGEATTESTKWDLKVAISPADVKVTEEGSTWQLTSSDLRGSLTVVVMRDANAPELRTLANGLRAERQKAGDDVSELEDDTLAGLAGVHWLSMSKEGSATFVVLAPKHRCVYMLIANARGTSEEIVAYFKWASASVRSVSGGPANARACE